MPQRRLLACLAVFFVCLLLPPAAPAQQAGQPPAEAQRLARQSEALAEQGRYAEAAPLAQKALVLTEQALGPEHPATAGALNDLAERLRNAGDFAKAEPLYRRALAIREKILKRVTKELPFVTAVFVDRIEERKPGEAGPTGGEGMDLAWEAPDEDDWEDDGEGPDDEVEAGPEDEEAADRETVEPASPEIVGFSEPDAETGKRKLTYVAATIFVERENHRVIILGRHGQVIKEIGTEARREIESILNSRVFLDLKIKVRHRWRDSAEVLDLIEGRK